VYSCISICHIQFTVMFSFPTRPGSAMNRKETKPIGFETFCWYVNRVGAPGPVLRSAGGGQEAMEISCKLPVARSFEEHLPQD
jgi:hypothetical protein